MGFSELILLTPILPIVSCIDCVCHCLSMAWCKIIKTCEYSVKIQVIRVIFHGIPLVSVV